MNIPLYIRLLPAAAFRAWFTPPPRTPRLEAAEGVERSEIETERGTITALDVGEGPVVLALHGWGGIADQMAPIGRRLAGDGYRVIAPDLPGRAGSEPTDLFEFVATVRALVQETGRPYGLVAHSFAALSLRLLGDLDGANPPPAAMVAPALSVVDSLATFSRRLRLAPWTEAGLRRRLQEWNPAVFEQLAGPHPEQLGEAEVLIVHDPADNQTPFSTAATLTALRPRTRLVPVEGGGHNGILAHPETLDAVSAFFARVGSEAVRGDGRANRAAAG